MEDSTADTGVEEEIDKVTAVEPELDFEDSFLESEEGDEQEEEEVVEEIEFDFGGNKFTVPKDSVPEDLAGEIDKFTKGTWSDYTKKSQAVAEATKSLEARESAVQKLEQLNGETLEVYSQGLAIRQELEQLAEVQRQNPNMWQSDPDQARQISDRISQKQAQFNSVISEVSQKESVLTQAKEAEISRRLKEGEQKVEKLIPGFGAKAPEVIEYVNKTFGIPKEEAKNWAVNPEGAVMAYESMMYRKMTAQAKKTAKPQIPDAKPVVSMKPKGKTQAKRLGDIKDPVEYRKRWEALQKQAG